MIDINEEMFSISDELARAFLNPNIAEQESVLMELAREFEKRKDNLVKKILKTLTDESANKICGNKYEPIRSRSTSPSALRSHSRGSRRSKINRSSTSQGSRSGITGKSPRRLSAEDQKGLTISYEQPKISAPYHSSIETTTNILLNKDDYY